MLPPYQNTALVLFTRTPQEEVSHKKIFAKVKVSKPKLFFRKLVEHANILGEKSGLTFFVVDSESQQGHTFGERLHQVFANFFARDFAKVIVIGNDCVSLRTQDIRQAATLLQQKAAVFGPARDGGVYLLGLDKSIFEQNGGFSQIHWQTATVLTELQAWCSSFENITLQPVYSDLDTWEDIQAAFFKKQLTPALLSFLAPVFLIVQYVSQPASLFAFCNLNFSLSFRGPPMFS